MRVGFITQLLWPRYGDFWVRLVEGVGAEARFPDPNRVLEQLADNRLTDVPGAVFRLAVAQALSLQETDLIVAPDLNFGTEVARGSGQDAFVASFPEALSNRFGGLPPVVGVPATLSGLETRAVEFLLALSRDAAQVRRVWERTRALAVPPRYPEPRWTVPPLETVGVVGQPWLLSDALVARLQGDTGHTVSQHRLEPQTLREEGWRAEPRLVPTDAEVLGAARLLGRRAAVTRLRFVADAGSGADAWLASQVTKLVHKPLSVTYLQDVLSADELGTLLSA
ncbi:hypothetical protein BH24DEI2_BH24DEI2_09230 [soil metagenome]